MMRLLWGILLSCFLCGEVMAALNVVQVDGPTVSSEPVLAEAPTLKQAPLSSLTQHKEAFSHKRIHTKNFLYPVKSDLTVGRLSSFALSSPQLLQPIFVIGDDAYSRYWAREHARELKSINALGFITNGSSAARVKLIEKQTGLALLPVSLDDLQRYLPVSHYPFLWTHKGIAQ